MSTLQKWLLVGIMLLAVFFRYYKIAELPGGLHPDEAANGLDINLMEQGHLQPFYERGNGREALFFYMEWASVSAFGRGPWQHHIVSSFVGVLAILLTFLVTRQLFSFGEIDETRKKRAINIALLSSFLMAVGSWYVTVTRTAFRANLIPLFTTLTFYLLLKTAVSEKLKHKLLFSFLTGAAFALGFYSYIGYRIMVPILFVLLLWPLLANLKKVFVESLGQYVKLALSFLVGFCLFIYPLAHYFWTHAGSFLGRSGQVSVFNPELNGGNLIAALITVFKLSILAYFTHGDVTWRHNVSGYPFLSPLISPFFGVALVAVTLLGIRYFFTPRSKSSYWKYFLLTLWFWVMLIPEVTTAEGIPHGLRAIGTIPVIYIISAFGLYEFGSYVMKFQREKVEQWMTPFRQKFMRRAFKLVFICFCAALIAQTYILYFIITAQSPENYYAFRSDLTAVSKYLKSYGTKQTTFLILDKYSLQTVDYETTYNARVPGDARNQPYTQVDPENSWQLPPLKPGEQIVFTQSTIFDTFKYKAHHPEAKLTLEVKNKFNQSILAVYKAN